MSLNSPSSSWVLDYRPVTSYFAYLILRIDPRTLCMLDKHPTNGTTSPTPKNDLFRVKYKWLWTWKPRSGVWWFTWDVSCSLSHLTIWSPVGGTVWADLGFVSLLEEYVLGSRLWEFIALPHFQLTHSASFGWKDEITELLPLAACCHASSIKINSSFSWF